MLWTGLDVWSIFPHSNFIILKDEMLTKSRFVKFIWLVDCFLDDEKKHQRLIDIRTEMEMKKLESFHGSEWNVQYPLTLHVNSWKWILRGKSPDFADLQVREAITKQTQSTGIILFGCGNIHGDWYCSIALPHMHTCWANIYRPGWNVSLFRSKQKADFNQWTCSCWCMLVKYALDSFVNN